MMTHFSLSEKLSRDIMMVLEGEIIRINRILIIFMLQINVGITTLQ